MISSQIYLFTPLLNMSRSTVCILLFCTLIFLRNCERRERICKHEQDKSSDIEQQPPFGDRKISNIQPQNMGGGSKPTGTSYNFDKV